MKIILARQLVIDRNALDLLNPTAPCWKASAADTNGDISLMDNLFHLINFLNVCHVHCSRQLGALKKRAKINSSAMGDLVLCNTYTSGHLTI